MKPKLRLLLDTNVIIDYLNERQPFYERARLVMICGKIGEFELWVTSSQMTDLVYVLSEGGASSRIPKALSVLRDLRTFVEVHPTGVREVDTMLATTWDDPEDALLHEAALSLGVDAIVTRNQSDFKQSRLRAFDCDELFAWLERDRGLAYGEIPFPLSKTACS